MVHHTVRGRNGLCGRVNLRVDVVANNCVEYKHSLSRVTFPTNQQLL